MTEELRNRIAKIYALVQRGATEGERAAAKKALDRLVSKYDLDMDEIDTINLVPRYFSYATNMEHWLLSILAKHIFNDDFEKEPYRTNYNKEALTFCRCIVFHLNYEDYVTMDCCYEYFRRHMKAQWKKHCAPVVSRKRKTKTKNEARKALQEEFFNSYIIASELIGKEHLISRDLSSMSKAELDRLSHVQGVEGGKYHTQMQSGHLLNETN